MSDLERLLMLYTGTKPDGSSFKGECGLEPEEIRQLANMLIEDNLRLTSELATMDENFAHQGEEIGELTELIEKYKVALSEIETSDFCPQDIARDALAEGEKK